MIRLQRLYAHNFKQLQEVELHFPAAARVLVQGRNEAGKSTLFEAIFFALFGSALVTETGARGIEDLIAYGVEKARVELDVDCGGRLFKIARTIVRGKPNVWELDIVRDGVHEEIRGNAVVNKRLVAELGFDGDALLNTCFVEQKKLEKLEGMSKGKREESLAKLLNLDALVDLENTLKLRAEDKQELERLKRRADLADIQAELPSCEANLANVESKLKLIDLRRALEGAVTEVRAVQRLDVTIHDLAARRDQTNAQLERVNALRQAMLDARDARDAAERLAENQREIERQQQEHAEARTAVEEGAGLPARAQALERLSRQLKRMDRIQGVQRENAARAVQLASAEARAAELSGELVREQEALARLDSQHNDYILGQALDEWMAARQPTASQAEMADTVQSRQAARAQLARRLRVEMYELGLLALLLVGASLLLPFAAVWLILAAVVAGILIARLTFSWRELARIAEELGQAEGEARVQAAANAANAAHLAEAETRLTQAGLPVPESIEQAQARRIEIARGLGSRTPDELRAEQDATRERLARARAVLDELRRQNGGGDRQAAGEERDECERRADKAGRLIGRWRPRIELSAQALEVEPEASVVERARYQAGAQSEQVQRHSQTAARLSKEIARRQEQARTLTEQAQRAYEKARALKPDALEWKATLGIAEYTALGKGLRSEFDALGGEAVTRAAREIEGEWGRRQGEHETRARNAELLLAKARQLLDELGQGEHLPADANPEELEALCARFQSIDLGDEATWRAQHRELIGRLQSLQDRRVQLERELGLAGEQLDAAECRAEFEEQAHAARVRERGAEIVALARRRIVHKVLPATMDYMRRILPTLTRDRYHDAQLDDESYKIQVWDERAGGTFKEKNIFSGGTKDQFSLALRLAFALATLPQERGAAPSFIFLDEPLGSFDQERAEALIYLLTEGEIARAFDQIFLISHVHVDERSFTHRVVLENGRVAYSDLPKE